MENLLFTINAILPIILPILLGYFLKRKKFLSESFLTESNKLVFKILIPILLFNNLYLADISNIDWKFVGFAGMAVIILFFIGMFIVSFIPDKKQKGVMLQASFRSNYAIIGIPLATTLGGETAGVEAAIIAAVTIPLFNSLAVVALSIYDADENNKISVRDILYKIITNPLIIGVMCGLIVCIITMSINYFFDVNTKQFLNENISFIPTTIKSVANICTPFALLVLGGRFEFKAVKSLYKQLIISVGLRLIVTPALFLSLAYILGFTSSTNFAILIALFATPIAVSSVSMAAIMGQDEELAGQIVVWTSTLSILSLFIIIMICSGIGIF